MNKYKIYNLTSTSFVHLYQKNPEIILVATKKRIY